jgi:hypothetical protein
MGACATCEGDGIDHHKISRFRHLYFVLSTITSGQGMVHPNYTSGSDPSEEHNDISQTSTLSSNRNIPPNVLPSNDWQSNPLMGLQV